jgi:DNA-binding NarL/FixJ family response regulator
VPTRPRVLLVDDHPGVVKALGRVLSRECDVVGVIADGREVADAARRLQPVVIVVDVNLPNVNGLDVCRQITQNTPRVKVIVISAMTDDDIRDDALAAGASGFFHKSAANELIAAIRRIWTEST